MVQQKITRDSQQRQVTNNRVANTLLYEAMRKLYKTESRIYTIEQLVLAGDVAKQAYHKWLNRTEIVNEELMEKLKNQITIIITTWTYNE